MKIYLYDENAWLWRKFITSMKMHACIKFPVNSQKRNWVCGHCNNFINRSLVQNEGEYISELIISFVSVTCTLVHDTTITKRY